MYDLTATTSDQTVTLTVPVDSTAPTITHDAAAQVASAFQVGEVVTITVTCTDPNAPNSSGVASCTPDERHARHVVAGDAIVHGDGARLRGQRADADVHVRRVRNPYRYTNVFPRTDRLNVDPGGLVSCRSMFKVFGPNGDADHIDARVHDDGLGAADVPVADAGQLPQSSMSNTTTNCFVLTTPIFKQLGVDVEVTEADPEPPRSRASR